MKNSHQSKAKESSTATYLLVVLFLISTIATIVMGALNAVQLPGLFNHSIADLSAKYFNEATPAGFVFSVIWPLIYAFALAGSVYLFASIFLPTNESPVKNVPTLTPQYLLIAGIVGSLSTIIWLFTFDREMLVPSFALLFVGVSALWEAVRIALTVVYDNLEQLQANSPTMLLVYRILIHNGLCLFATWATIATILGFVTALVYIDSPGFDSAQLRGFVSQETGSTIGLALLFVIVLGIFIMENFVYEPYFRYVFSIFPVFVFALIGLVVQLSAVGAYRNLQIAAIELGVVIVCLIVRIVLSVFRLSTSGDYYLSKTPSKVNLLVDD